MTTYWQVAAGDDSRDYVDEFLKYGIAFVGNPQRPTMEQVNAGDILLLKRGLSKVIAVGRAVNRVVDGDDICVGFAGEHRKWLRDFDGWDLPSYCNVDWHVPDEPKTTTGLTIATIQRANQTNHIELAKSVLASAPVRTHFEPDPLPTNDVSDADILNFLIHEGMRPGLAEDLTSAFRRIRLLANYYYVSCKRSDVKEHETRTFLIMPLLLALGWAEQQIKIELSVAGGRIDVACFARPYRRDAKGKPNNDDCVLLLESKGFSSGLRNASNQVKEYAEHFPLCKVLVVSNGFCYKTYRRTDTGFSSKPDAYLNLLRPQDRYPLDPDNVKGCLAVLEYLLPRSVG